MFVGKVWYNRHMEVKEFLPSSPTDGYNGINPDGDVVFVDWSEMDTAPFAKGTEDYLKRGYDGFIDAKTKDFTIRNQVLLDAMEAAGASNRDSGAVRSGKDIRGVRGAEDRAERRRQEALSLAGLACKNCPLFNFCPTAGNVPDGLLFDPRTRNRARLRVSGGKARDLGKNNMLCETNMRPGKLDEDIPVL